MGKMVNFNQAYQIMKQGRKCRCLIGKDEFISWYDKECNEWTTLIGSEENYIYMFTIDEIEAIWQVCDEESQ
jgi:hypothetical protein